MLSLSPDSYNLVPARPLAPSAPQLPSCAPSKSLSTSGRLHGIRLSPSHGYAHNILTRECWKHGPRVSSCRLSTYMTERSYVVDHVHYPCSNFNMRCTLHMAMTVIPLSYVPSRYASRTMRSTLKATSMSLSDCRIRVVYLHPELLNGNYQCSLPHRIHRADIYVWPDGVVSAVLAFDKQISWTAAAAIA